MQTIYQYLSESNTRAYVVMFGFMFLSIVGILSVTTPGLKELKRAVLLLLVSLTGACSTMTEPVASRHLTPKDKVQEPVAPALHVAPKLHPHDTATFGR